MTLLTYRTNGEKQIAQSKDANGPYQYSQLKKNESSSMDNIIWYSNMYTRWWRRRRSYHTRIEICDPGTHVSDKLIHSMTCMDQKIDPWNSMERSQIMVQSCVFNSMTRIIIEIIASHVHFPEWGRWHTLFTNFGKISLIAWDHSKDHCMPTSIDILFLATIIWDDYLWLTLMHPSRRGVPIGGITVDDSHMYYCNSYY